jgi:predicted Zn finger-like uncharacterized protein
MRCKICDYQLWNLPSRRCPECGTPFRVSDYEFVPNSVQFRCPHCGQAYYGTGPKGHLVPEAFTCVKCGSPLNMNDMVLLPAEGLEDEQTEVYRMPWLDRRRNGWWRSWWATVKMSLTSPARVMRGLPPDSSVRSAVWFAVATWMVTAGLIMLTTLGLMAVIGLFSGSAPMRGVGMAPLFVLTIFAALALLPVAVWAGIAHVVLLATGGTRYGFGRTCEAIFYSAGTNVLLLIPGCGAYIYWIWWLVSAAIMLKQGQRVHGLRATLAVLALPVLLIACPISMFILSAPRPVTVPAPPPASPLPSPLQKSAESSDLPVARQPMAAKLIGAGAPHPLFCANSTGWHGPAPLRGHGLLETSEAPWRANSPNAGFARHAPLIPGASLPRYGEGFLAAGAHL